MSEVERIRRWYSEYEAQRGKLRSDLQRTKGVLLQMLAWEASIVRACQMIPNGLSSMKLLDAGGGGEKGSSCFFLWESDQRTWRV